MVTRCVKGTHLEFRCISLTKHTNDVRIISHGMFCVTKQFSKDAILVLTVFVVTVSCYNATTCEDCIAHGGNWCVAQGTCLRFNESASCGCQISSVSECVSSGIFQVIAFSYSCRNVLS